MMIFKNFYRRMNRTHYNFGTNLRKQDIVNSTYEQLVGNIAKTYNLQEIDDCSSQCLLEIQHQFKIMKSGDKILDIGAGPSYGWTNLALKYTQNTAMSNLVVSNDPHPYHHKQRKNHIFVQGNFEQQPVQTNISLHLQSNKLDVILMDVSPNYTGQIVSDSAEIFKVITSTFQFFTNFLKHGGIFVCKFLQSDVQTILKESTNIIFNQIYRYVPSIVRKTSPVCFYIFKGYMMNSNLYTVDQFLSKYNKTHNIEKKIKLVNQNIGKYSWDPIKILRKQALQRITQLRMQGKNDRDILNAMKRDPFSEVQKIIKQHNRYEKACRQNNNIEKMKAINAISGGQIYKNAEQLPSNQEQMIEMFEKFLQKQKLKLKPKQISDRQPLADDEIFMKSQIETTQEKIEKIYLQSDLLGQYREDQQKAGIQKEMNKLEKVYPKIRKDVEKLQQSIQTGVNVDPKQFFSYFEESGSEEIDHSKSIDMHYKKISELQDQKNHQQQIMKQSLKRQQKKDRYVNQKRSKKKAKLF